ncbi:hypothetical protein DERP_007075 [Dermatophagoides pteronyssinus]|uniref:Uncharacterized protein n=1 Tax=Dermatophagoides pteronyssinus TaxID=6956 RepID=A0ABQ8JUJ4_DERPT|nr:hypothetical protein DERP_007075 [Dermatophagoides pteronyssinus]
MAFAIYLRHQRDFQPEHPQILEKNINDPNVRFTFVDFIPGVIKPAGSVMSQSSVEYHSFSTMIKVANQWLQNHHDEWEFINGETIIIPIKYNDQNQCYELKTNDCCYYIYGSETNNVLRAFRLWIRRRRRRQLHKRQNNQQICFKDIIPRMKNDITCEFEDLDDVIKRFNDEIIQNNGFDGRILAIESASYDANLEWEINTEQTLSILSTKNLFILRIFYETLNNDNQEKLLIQIGIEDFHPRQLTRSTFFRRPKFECFDQVIERGSLWLRQQTNQQRQRQFLNAQSLDVKMKSTNPKNGSRSMAFTEHGAYMRIFQSSILQQQQQQQQSSSPPSMINLGNRLFTPTKRTDTITDIVQQLHDWIKHYTAETVEIFMKDLPTNRSDIERAANDDTFLVNRFGNKNAYLFFSFRLFYDSTLTMISDSITNMTNLSETMSTISSNADSSWTIDICSNDNNNNDDDDETINKRIKNHYYPNRQ